MDLKTFRVEFTLTERVRKYVEIEADSLEDAVRAVEEYEVDTSEAVEVDSLEWSISDVEAKES